MTSFPLNLVSWLQPPPESFSSLRHRFHRSDLNPGNPVIQFSASPSPRFFRFFWSQKPGFRFQHISISPHTRHFTKPPFRSSLPSLFDRFFINDNKTSETCHEPFIEKRNFPFTHRPFLFLFYVFSILSAAFC